MTDYEAWTELCDLYLSQADYSSAAFCMEELLMSNPHNHLFHQKYAEIRYSQGGNDNMEVARSYFAQAAKLQAGNLRALYGLFLAASNLATSSGKGAKDKQANHKYASWAAGQIRARYTQAGVSSQDMAETCLTQFLDGHLESLQVNTLS